MIQRKPEKTLDFTEVLDALEAIDGLPFAKFTADEDAGPAVKSPYLYPDRVKTSKAWLLQMLGTVTGRRYPPGASLADEPEDDAEAPDIAAGIPLQFSPSEQEAIAMELGLTGTETHLELQKIRRDFAKENHPDRCSEEFRDHATKRMTIANMLIDNALKKWKA